MRTSSVAVLLVLAACTGEPANDDATAGADIENRIECAVNGNTEISATCAIERGPGNALALRHPDGGFRRLTIETDGTIDTADGAESIVLVPMPDGRSEITIGTDRYRLPADL